VRADRAAAGLIVWLGGIEACPAMFGIDNSHNYSYITSDATVKTMPVFSLKRGHGHIRIITAPARRDPYVF
jgi:hypothetical protein